MTIFHFQTKRSLVTLLACVGLLAACGGGHYNSDGTYVSGNTSYDARNPSQFPSRHKGYDQYSKRGDASHARIEYGQYDRAGYYDHNAYYVDRSDSLNVPKNMIPARGMCRVWFSDRALADQPNIESCSGIKSRVPAGAYVIYGG